MKPALEGRAEAGRRGEALVAARLEADGYFIEARNWRCANGELDIVASMGALLVIVEVRTVTTTFLDTPTRTVNRGKQGRLSRAADAYLRVRDGVAPEHIRFDVAGVHLVPDAESIEYIEDAFVPDYAF